jgi:hypothetical protein
MTVDFLPITSGGYWVMLALLVFARGMDFLSTWLATPSLMLEGNPIAKKLGWKLGGLVNLVLCFAFAFWPLTAIIIITAGLLVAAHNFHSAWIMRSMGEEAYRDWFVEQISRARFPLFLVCLMGETALTGLVGLALLFFSDAQSVAFAVGIGVLAYAGIVLIYTALSLWRMRQRLE